MSRPNGRPSAKAEAKRAIEHVRTTIAGHGDLGGLERRLLASTLEYAAEQVEAIVEVKRVRIKKEGA